MWVFGSGSLMWDGWEASLKQLNRCQIIWIPAEFWRKSQV